jgi:hypothetical protein
MDSTHSMMASSYPGFYTSLADSFYIFVPVEGSTCMKFSREKKHNYRRENRMEKPTYRL